MTMGQRIRECRRSKDFTQKELAEKLNVKEAAVSKWESGVVENIPRSTIKTMADLLEVHPCYLMGFSDDPNPPKGPESIYDRVTIELGGNAGNMLKYFMELNPAAQSAALAMLEGLAAVPSNHKEKVTLKNA